jgi:UDP-glucose 4-epimerase
VKILITGATGYLGSRVAEHLADEGHEVVALMRSPISDGSHWAKKMAGTIIGDIRESEPLDHAADLDLDAVVHTVSLDHNKSELDPSNTCATNVTSTWRLLSRLAPLGLKRFIYFSTQQVYGRTGPIDITEATQPFPVNAYGLTHLMSEQVCELFNSRTETICLSLRISNGFGAPVFQSCNCWWLVINDFCKTALEKGEIRLSSDGTPQRDFIHIVDISRAVAFLLKQSAQDIKDRCYNLGGGETFTILELAHIVQDVCQRELQRNIPIIMSDQSISTNADNHKTVDRFQYDNTRLHSMGFKNAGSLQNGITEVLSFLQQTV